MNHWRSFKCLSYITCCFIRLHHLIVNFVIIATCVIKRNGRFTGSFHILTILVMAYSPPIDEILELWVVVETHVESSTNVDIMVFVSRYVCDMHVSIIPTLRKVKSSPFPHAMWIQTNFEG